jgi:hypothetical protein
VKRSAAVPLTLATTLSAGALAAACAQRPQEQAMQCVDKTTQRVVPDSVCARAGVAPASGAANDTARGAVARHGGGFPLGGVFAWYYGGRIVQGLVSGGSYAPIAGRAYRSPSGFVAGPASVRPRSGAFDNRSSGRSGVSRGGFGSTGAGRVGGS